jgi:basic membrane protein A and related proteins
MMATSPRIRAIDRVVPLREANPSRHQNVRQEGSAMKKTLKLGLSAASAIALAVGLAACSSAPTTAKATGAGAKYLPCIVSDGPNFNDHSFNQLSLAGVTEAAAKDGSTYHKVTSASANDYASNVTALVGAGCNMVVAPGYELVPAIKAAAQANPKVDFTMVDDNSISLPNVKPIVFQSDQAAFLGGYLAAAYSKTGVVATYGGALEPTVTIYMDGIADGVAYYDKQEHKAVKLLGWNESTQQGTFVGNFNDQNGSKTIAMNFLQQKADVLIPVAGPLYEGAGAAIDSSGSAAVLEGVDADLYKTDASGYKDLILTSILKNIQPLVAGVVEQAAAKKFSNAPYVGTLKNNGVALAPYHALASKVPASVTSQLAKIKQGIIDGSITVASPSAYKQ